MCPEAEGDRPLTGRAVHQRKLRADDEAHRLDIATLRRRLRTLGSQHWTSRWGVGAFTWSQVFLGLDMSDKGPEMVASLLVAENRLLVDSPLYRIPLDSTVPYYGGRRWWFRCPAVVDGAPCNRRVRILYLPRGASCFACRSCYQLTYRSRQKSRNRFFEGLERPRRCMERVSADLGSRSPRRRLRALLRSGLGPELRKQMRLAGIGLDHRGRPE